MAHFDLAHATPLQCLKGLAATSTLPSSLPIGVETIHKDASKIITIFVPLAPEGSPSRILDGNAKNPDPKDRMPARFAMSDGTVRAAFVGVDTHAGTLLDACLSEISAKITDKKPETLIAYIRDRIQDDFLKAPPKNYVFSWDKKYQDVPEELTELFRAAKDMSVGQYPIRSKRMHDVVPLEKFLNTGYGTCLHKALLASLLLTRHKIPHRLVNGANHANGHTWIELADGRILDPSLKKLEQQEPSKAFEGWIKYGENSVFENQVWPYLSLD
jgi:hypothetical protein